MPVDIRPAESVPVRVIPAAPAIDEQLRRLLSARPLTWSGDVSSKATDAVATAWIDFDVSNSPVPIAFRVYVVLDGREWYLGDLTNGTGASVATVYDFPCNPDSVHLGANVPLVALKSNQHCRLVFRPDPGIAARTLDLVSCYGGEIMLDDVPIEDAAAARERLFKQAAQKLQ